MSEFRLATARLAMRSWRDGDLAPFHAICSDPVVMATLGALMTFDEVALRVSQMQAMQAELGHCFWALERRADARLIGWCGVIRGSAGPVSGKAELDFDHPNVPDGDPLQRHVAYVQARAA